MWRLWVNCTVSIGVGERVVAAFTGEEILEITMGRMVSGLVPEEAGSICTDTRRLKEGQWYLALPGRTFDGHDFLGDAFAGGAIGCIVAERPSYAIASGSFPLIAVDDTSTALAELAQSWISRQRLKTLLICGEVSDIRVVTELLEAIAKIGGNRVSSLGLCRGIDDTCSALLQVSQGAQFIVAGLNPTSIGEILPVGLTLRPELVVFGSWTFANLRLMNSAEQLLSAKLNLARQKTAPVKIVLCGPEERSVVDALSVDHFVEAYACPLSLGSAQTEVEIWPTKAPASKLSFGSYLPVLRQSAQLINFEQAWICVTVGALIGIEPDAIEQALKLASNFDSSELF